jgi:predicted RNA-binding Zn-ribbon protein involved in translation (DUF1610 family)
MGGQIYHSKAELESDLSHDWGVRVEVVGRSALGHYTCPKCGEPKLLFRENCAGSQFVYEQLALELPPDGAQDTREYQRMPHARTCGIKLPREKDGYKEG